jgi:DNA-binding winged helix-turn-helix (wHTH) protein
MYRFDQFAVDPANMRLTAGGENRPLEPKSFRLLQFLIENRHRVVPKDEIPSVVWEGVAVSDNALTRAVAQVRKVLDDDPKQPRYIETVPTVGYRFAADPHPEESLADAIPLAPAAAKNRTQIRPLVWAGLASERY